MRITATAIYKKYTNRHGLLQLYSQTASLNHYNSPWSFTSFYPRMYHSRRQCFNHAHYHYNRHSHVTKGGTSNVASNPFHHRKRSRCVSGQTGMMMMTNPNYHAGINSAKRLHTQDTNFATPQKSMWGDKDHEPPLPLRVALVSCSTALCTPIFPAIGFVQLGLRALLSSSSDAQQRRYKLTAYFGTICNVAFYYVLPISYELSPILLPCAIGNGLVAGSSYWALDGFSRQMSKSSSKVLRDGQMWLKHPLVVGGGIGAWTGLAAPSFLYGSLCYALYGVEGISDVVSRVFWTLPMLPQISCMTGFVAGIFMYPFLYYPIHGIKGVSWKKFSGVVLMGTGLTLYHVYKGPEKDRMVGISEGAFVLKSNVPLLSTIVRYNNIGGQWGAYSLQSLQWMGGPELKEKGQVMAETVRKYQAPGWWWVDKKRSKYYTFDDQILAFYYEWLDETIGERYQDHVVHVREANELQTIEQNMLQTDWVVKCVLEHGQNSLNGEDGINTTWKDQMIQELRNVTCLKMTDTHVKKFVESVSTVSDMMKIIMSMKKQKQQLGETPILSVDKTDIDAIIQEMETQVRKLTPGIVLYKEEETDGFKGQSVESQLEAMSWEPPPFETSAQKWQDLKSLKRSVIAKRVLIGALSCAALVVVFFKQQ